MQINMGRANAERASKVFSMVVNRLGESKSADKANSTHKGANGHQKAEYVHSAKAMDNFRSVTRSYFSEVKSMDGSLKGNINEQTAERWIVNRLESGKINGNSANTYLSMLQNIGLAQEHLGMRNTLEAETIKDIRDSLREQGYDLSAQREDRAYSSPDQIAQTMHDHTSHGLSAELQLEAGMRSGDAIDSSKWRVTDHGTIEITGSKNGMTYETRGLDADLLDRVQTAIDQGYSIDYGQYREALKASSPDEWHGTHGLRYNFAQYRVSELQAEGRSYTEALGQTSLEMGHSRVSITLHYLSG